jgi:hypothetical protein
MTQEIKKPENPFVYPNNFYGDDPGITLRDMYANSALIGLLTSKTFALYDIESYAEQSYKLADAMLEAREQFKNK